MILKNKIKQNKKPNKFLIVLALLCGLILRMPQALD